MDAPNDDARERWRRAHREEREHARRVAQMRAAAIAALAPQIAPLTQVVRRATAHWLAALEPDATRFDETRRAHIAALQTQPDALQITSELLTVETDLADERWWTWQAHSAGSAQIAFADMAEAGYPVAVHAARLYAPPIVLACGAGDTPIPEAFSVGWWPADRFFHGGRGPGRTAALNADDLATTLAHFAPEWR